MKRFFLIHCLFLHIALVNITLANETDDRSILSFKYFTLTNETEVKNQEKRIIKSAFYPELSLNTGIGNIKSYQENEIERGPFVYLEGEFNLYRGGKDHNNLKIVDTEIQTIEWKKIIEKRELSINTFKIVSEIKSLKNIEKLTREEIIKNKLHEEMAKKKVNAGLSSSLDLIDFQLKDEALNNQLEDNELKLFELEASLKSLYAGNTKAISEVYNNETIYDEQDFEINPYPTEKAPQLLIGQNNLSIAELEKNNSQAEFLPTVAINSQWGQITPHDKVFDRKAEYSIMLNIHFPLFNGFSSSAKYQQAIINLSQKTREKNQTLIEIETNKDLILKRIASLKRKLATLENSLKNSKEYLQRTLAEYKRGVKNSPDVILASDKVFSSSTDIEEIKTELKNNIYAYNLTYKPL